MSANPKAIHDAPETDLLSAQSLRAADMRAPDVSLPQRTSILRGLRALTVLSLIVRHPMNIRGVLFAVCAMPFLSGVGLAGNVASDDELPSVCYGDAASGRLERGRRLPYSGENYRAYSMVGFCVGAHVRAQH